MIIIDGHERCTSNHYCLLEVLDGCVFADVFFCAYQMVLKFSFGYLIDLVLNHRWIEKSGTDSDIDGSLNLVTGQNPNLNSSIFHIPDGISNLILKSILNSRRSNKLKIYFNLLINRSNFSFSIIDFKLGLLWLLIPCGILLLANIPLRKEQSSEPLLSILIHKSISFLQYLRISRFHG